MTGSPRRDFSRASSRSNLNNWLHLPGIAVMVDLEAVSMISLGEGCSSMAILEPVGRPFYIFHKIWSFPLALQFC